MSDPLEDLIGLRVAKSRTVHGYAQVIFGDVAGLRIFNDYTVSDDKPVVQLTGLALVSVSENADEVVLTFEGRNNGQCQS